jgi:hypothetical protein
MTTAVAAADVDTTAFRLCRRSSGRNPAGFATTTAGIIGVVDVAPLPDVVSNTAGVVVAGHDDAMLGALMGLLVTCTACGAR